MEGRSVVVCRCSASANSLWCKRNCVFQKFFFDEGIVVKWGCSHVSSNEMFKVKLVSNLPHFC